MTSEVTQQCCRRVMSSVMWRCVTGLLRTNVYNGCCAFRTPGTTNPTTLSLSQKTPKSLGNGCLHLQGEGWLSSGTCLPNCAASQPISHNVNIISNLIEKQIVPEHNVTVVGCGNWAVVITLLWLLTLCYIACQVVMKIWIHNNAAWLLQTTK